MADAEARVEAPPEDAPPAEEAAPAEGDAAPVDKLAKWKKATRLQVNAMRMTGAKAVSGAVASNIEPSEGDAAAADVPADAPKKDMKAMWGKAGKFVKQATAFGSKPETAEAVPEDFRMPASIEADAAAAVAAPEAEAPAAVPTAAASRWAKAKKGLSMVRALG